MCLLPISFLLHRLESRTPQFRPYFVARKATESSAVAGTLDYDVVVRNARRRVQGIPDTVVTRVVGQQGAFQVHSSSDPGTSYRVCVYRSYAMCTCPNGKLVTCKHREKVAMLYPGEVSDGGEGHRLILLELIGDPIPEVAADATTQDPPPALDPVLGRMRPYLRLASLYEECTRLEKAGRTKKADNLASQHLVPVGKLHARRKDRVERTLGECIWGMSCLWLTGLRGGGCWTVLIRRFTTAQSPGQSLATGHPDPRRLTGGEKRTPHPLREGIPRPRCSTRLAAGRGSGRGPLDMLS